MSDETQSNSLIWEADSTDPEKAETIRQALREVSDPELGLSIIELGLVRQVSIADEAVHIKMLLTTPFCPYGPAMMESTRAKAAEATEMEATIELSLQPWDPSYMEEGVRSEWGLF